MRDIYHVLSLVTKIINCLLTYSTAQTRKTVPQKAKTIYIDIFNTKFCDIVTLTFLLSLPVLSVLFPLEFFVYLRLIIGTLFLCMSAHLTFLLYFPIPS